MKCLSYISSVIVMFVLSLSLWQCAGVKQTDTIKLLDVKAVYYMQLDTVNWQLSVIYKSQNVWLDHVYFQGKKITLSEKNDTLYTGVYKKEQLKKGDVIMSNDPFAEYGNKLPKLPEKMPFELKDNECMIGYKNGDGLQYFKYSKVVKK